MERKKVIKRIFIAILSVVVFSLCAYYFVTKQDKQKTENKTCIQYCV